MAGASRRTAWSAAALLLGGLLVALLLVPTDGVRAPTSLPAPPPVPDVQPASPADAASTTVAPAPEPVAPPELLATADELQAQYDSLKGDMPEELSGPMDQEIGVVEGAVANLLAAIAQEPENESLKRMLVATYRNEVRLLKKALHLSGDAPDEDIEP